MNRRFAFLCLIFLSLVPLAMAQQPKPPVGVPMDARFFNGKWYHVYFEDMGWKQARERCKKLGGQLVVIHDAATWEYVRGLANGLALWLGATDEVTEGLWVWVDGKPMTFKAWNQGEPTNGQGRQHCLQTWKGGWNDLAGDDKGKWRSVGFICEWPVK